MGEEIASMNHLPGCYQSLLMYLYPYLGLPIDQVNMLVVLLFQALVGSVWRRITNTFIRRLLGMLLGFSFLYSMYGTHQSFGLLLFITLMYPIIKLKNARISFWVGMTSLFLCFSYMAYFHYLSWRLDFTTSMMGIMVRLHSLTWDLIDFDKIKNKENLGNFKRFTQFRQKHACDTKDITFFVYMCYMLFFVHVLCGSNLTINEYLWISDRSIYKREGWKDHKNDPQPTFAQICIGLSYAVICAGVYLFAQTAFNFSFLTSTEYTDIYPLWKKAPVLYLSVFLNKFKYHVGWKMLDVSLITSGAGFSGVEYEGDGTTVKEIKWERANNIHSIQTAFPQNTADVVRTWNMTINDWLTFYVFFRIEKVPKILTKMFGSKGAKVMVTRIASGLFHGVYPSYYCFFFWSAVITNTIDVLRLILPTFEDEVNIKKQSPYALKSQMLWVSWMLIATFPMDSVGFFFMELDIFRAFSVFNSIYWLPMIIAFIYLILGQILLRTMGIKQTEKKKRSKRKSIKKEQ